MSNKGVIRIGAAALLLAVAWQCDALAAPAQTPAGENLPQAAVVHFGDLNLDRPSDVATLYRRIRLAAQSVCGERLATGSYIFSRDWYSCVEQAVQRGIVAVDRSTLTAYYRVHTPPAKRRS
jgi:UrcA family protein